MSDANRPSGSSPPAAATVEDASRFLDADRGGRHPDSALVVRLIAGVAVAWSLFQLWIASPLPFLVGRLIPVLNSTEARSIHLAFALFLAFLAFPVLKSGPGSRVPVYDWIFAAAGVFCAGYIFLFYDELSRRPGLPTALDLAVAAIGLLLLLEATRRALGPALPIVGLVSLGYVFFGHGFWVPEALQWHGASIGRAMSHMWLTTEGVFGVALGVSTSFIFLYVLFGALLDGAGAGNYFIKIAFSLLGRLRGGPAKAAVVASGLNGLVSGSSIANVVTGGSLTIPLMMRVGYSPAKAAAIEVASSVNGQIMPPVMGAAAFLMVEYVGISYPEVIRHAFLPAIIAYIALLYIVHLEALKLGMQGLPGVERPWSVRLLRAGIGVTSFLIVLGLIYYAVKGVQALFGGASFWVVFAGFLLLYVGLLFIASRQPDLPMDDPSEEIIEPPPFLPVLLTGLHFILPVYVLVWCLMVEFLSPGLAAY
ncbi:MAG: TRAP transporter permease, partial [Geminicoccales bacterium]